MKTNEFLNTLKANQHLPLIFSYRPEKNIAPGYHITEVKNIAVDAVDCGGNTDMWNETVIQLWEVPESAPEDRYMTALKALGILNKVAQLRPMDKDAEVKFEYSNADFHTSQMSVSGIHIGEKSLVVQLYSDPTDCKAKSDCGVKEPAMASQEACCEPGSGCC